MSPSSNALNFLRKALLALTPTGANGFEGLAASSLGALTGMAFRLAKSGSQGGRDASNASSDPFAISLECKLYTDRLTLERLAGKLIIAANTLDGRIDLWALAATSEVGDQVEKQLTTIVEDRGVSLVLLDWTAQGVPPLAVLLAAMKEQTLRWFSQHVRKVDRRRLAQALDYVRNEPLFESQLERLRLACTASEVGLDSLRRKSRAWLQSRFENRELSQVAFGQRISTAADHHVLPRPNLTNELIRLIAMPESTDVIAVLGGEGAGKTWIVAQWVSLQPDPPVVLFVAGRRTDLLDSSDTVLSLARLFAQQDGRSDDRSVESWRRRLERWKSASPASTPRFIVVLDGLNERSTSPWAEIIRSLVVEIAALGGRIIVTSRVAFWERDVRPRLPTGIGVREMTIPDYSDEELEIQLQRSGRKLADIPIQVRAFIRNPRVCAVAVAILDRLLLQPENLTVERLLLEYWRSRLEERSNAIAHTINDFHKLIRGHAKAWLAEPGKRFQRDEWLRHSGAAQRLGPERVVNDLTEIEEGRFLDIDPQDLSSYSFRSEALPFALALLITSELKEELGKEAAPSEVLERIIEPVAGFDGIADVLAASAGLACLEAGFPAEGRAAIILRWLHLQNISDSAFESMTAHVPANPGAFLDLAELPATHLVGANHDQSLTGLLLAKRDSPSVADALQDRINRWLGAWARPSRHQWGEAEQASHQARRDAWIDRAQAELDHSGQELWRSFAVEMPEPSEIFLDTAAARLLAARPLKTHAGGLIGWAFARQVAGDPPDGAAELEWVVRLNQLDWNETRNEVVSLLAPVGGSSSKTARAAAAMALQLLGDAESAARAELLHPQEHSRGWTRSDQFCDVNPFDPESDQPSNLVQAKSVVAGLSIEAIWPFMSPTAEDHNLADAIPALVRFDPETLIAKLNEVAATASQRTGLSLRQLSWRLPWLAPILTADSLASVREAFTLVLGDRTRLPKEDSWAIGQIAECLLARSEADQQLAILQSLPEDLPYYYSLLDGLKPLASAALEGALVEGLQKGLDSMHFQRVLFMACGARQQLTQRSREIIAAAMFSENRATASKAATVVSRSLDRELADLVASQLELRNTEPDQSEDAFAMGRAIAQSVVMSGRTDLLRQVPWRFLGPAAARLGGEAVGRFGAYLDATLSRLMEPVSSTPPARVLMYQETSRDNSEITAWCEEEPDISQQPDLRTLLNELANPAESSLRHASREKEMIASAQAYRNSLSLEAALEVVSVPSREGIAVYANRYPGRVEEWLNRILTVADLRLLQQVRNVGLTIASVHAVNNGALAAAVFSKLANVESTMQIVVGQDRIPYYEHVLFSAGDCSDLDSLRTEIFEDALNDKALETAAVAADIEGAGAWLDAYLDRLVSRNTPGALARALTIAGMRLPNAHSDGIFARAHGGGFVGKVAAVSASRYRRATWARHWLEKFAAAETGRDIFVYGRLLEGVADIRIHELLARGPLLDNIKWQSMNEILGRLRKAAQKEHKQGERLLFAHKAPSRELSIMLRDRLP